MKIHPLWELCHTKVRNFYLSVNSGKDKNQEKILKLAIFDGAVNQNVSFLLEFFPIAVCDSSIRSTIWIWCKHGL